MQGAELLIRVRMDELPSLRQLTEVKRTLRCEVDQLVVPSGMGTRSSVFETGTLTLEVVWQVGASATDIAVLDSSLAHLGTEEAVLWILQHYAMSEQAGIGTKEIYQYLMRHGKEATYLAAKSAAERLLRKRTQGVFSRLVGEGSGPNSKILYYYLASSEHISDASSAPNDVLANQVDADRSPKDIDAEELVVALRQCGGTNVAARQLKRVLPLLSWPLVHRFLKNLADDGEVVISGERAGTRYSLVDVGASSMKKATPSVPDLGSAN